MKKIFSIVAFVAMLCVPFSFVSCGSDEPEVPTPEPGTSVTTYSVTYSTTGQVVSVVHQFLLGKLSSELESQSNGGGAFILTAYNKEKADALLRGLTKYNDEITKLVQENGNPSYFGITIKQNEELLYKYEYNREELMDVAGTYTHEDPDKAGAVWSVTFTNTPAERDGYKTGSVTIPYDINGVKAGTYEGTYQNRANVIMFKTVDSKGEITSTASVTAGFNMATEDGIPMTFMVGGKTVFSKVVFKKK